VVYIFARKRALSKALYNKLKQEVFKITCAGWGEIQARKINNSYGFAAAPCCAGLDSFGFSGTI